MATTYVLDESLTSDHHLCSSISFVSWHRSEPGFESSVVTLDAVIGVLVSVVKRVRDEFFDDGLQGLGQISYHLVWFPVSDERSSEEVRAAGMLRRGETNTSMTWLDWSTAR